LRPQQPSSSMEKGWVVVELLSGKRWSREALARQSLPPHLIAHTTIPALPPSRRKGVRPAGTL
jgi:hypothetical protein